LYLEYSRRELAAGDGIPVKRNVDACLSISY
jgi:hypothetical protein